jgi:hypothetical protein
MVIDFMSGSIDPAFAGRLQALARAIGSNRVSQGKKGLQPRYYVRQQLQKQ